MGQRGDALCPQGHHEQDYALLVDMVEIASDLQLCEIPLGYQQPARALVERSVAQANDLFLEGLYHLADWKEPDLSVPLSRYLSRCSLLVRAEVARGRRRGATRNASSGFLVVDVNALPLLQLAKRIRLVEIPGATFVTMACHCW